MVKKKRKIIRLPIIIDVPVYYFDRIRINSKEDINSKNEKLLSEILERGHYRYEKPYPLAKRFGYKSKLEIFAPTDKCLKNLYEYEHIFGDYRISYIEITKDTSCESEQDAKEMADDYWRIRKKYSGGFVYNNNYTYPANRKKGDGLYPLNTTFYYGSRDFKFVVYSRRSKLNGRPCIHEEWRIQGSTRIRQKTYIKSIADLIAFKLDVFLESQDKKYLVHEEVNNDKIALWILGWTRKKKFTREETMMVIAQLSHFWSDYKINTPAQLITFFKNEKARIKSKRGRRTTWERKVDKVNPAQFLTRMSCNNNT